jgi:hypothetical protein
MVQKVDPPTIQLYWMPYIKVAFLDPYLGTRATDINVDGGEFVGPYESHAPEELVPGAVFDTMDLRVYTSDW